MSTFVFKHTTLFFHADAAAISDNINFAQSGAKAKRDSHLDV